MPLGLCVYCGRPAVIKADGTPARRCELCSGSHVRQKRDARHGIETRGRVTGRPRGHVEQKYYQRPGQELVTCPDCGIRTNADYWYCPYVSYTHIRAQETESYLVCSLLRVKKK